MLDSEGHQIDIYQFADVSVYTDTLSICALHPMAVVLFIQVVHFILDYISILQVFLPDLAERGPMWKMVAMLISNRLFQSHPDCHRLNPITEESTSELPQGNTTISLEVCRSFPLSTDVAIIIVFKASRLSKDIAASP